jgi:CYTH domain-containing protein
MVQKYSLPEIERRWLVRAEAAPLLGAAHRRVIEDKYIEGGRLRLRAVFTEGAETVFKLGKKYAREGSRPEQIVTIYLVAQEYQVLRELPGATSRKVRYSIEGGSLDIYEYPSSSPIIFEIEFPSEAAADAYVAPAFVGEEITFNANYSGYALAQRAL